jgi:hypothetical protein
LNKKSSDQASNPIIDAKQPIKHYNNHKTNNKDVMPHDTIHGKLNKVNGDITTLPKIQKQNAVQQANPYGLEQQEKKEELRQKQLQHQQIHNKQSNKNQNRQQIQLIPGLRGPLDETKRRHTLGYVYIKPKQSNDSNKEDKVNKDDKVLAEGTIRKMSQLFPDKKLSKTSK